METESRVSWEERVVGCVRLWEAVKRTEGEATTF